MKAIIIDDEPMPGKQLASLIKRNFFEIKEMEIYLSASEAINRLREEVFDILFLDIEMPEMDGFELLNRISLPKETNVIFTTAYQKYAVEAFEVNALHYLVKPITEEALARALKKVHYYDNPEHKATSNKGFFSVFNNNEHHIIKEEEIIRLEGNGSYTKIILADKTLLSSKNIGWNQEKLSSQLFFRTHKSHLVNLNRIERLSKGKSGYIVLSNTDVIPLASTRQEALERRMGL